MKFKWFLNIWKSDRLHNEINASESYMIFNFSLIGLKQTSKYLTVHSFGISVQEHTLRKNVKGDLAILIPISMDISIDPEILLLEIYFMDTFVYVGNGICQSYSWKP